MPTTSEKQISKPPPKLPISWVILLLFLAIAYAIFQPWANTRLGLKLPSLIQLVSPENNSSSTGKSNRPEVLAEGSEDTLSDKSITADERQADNELSHSQKRDSSAISSDSLSSGVTASTKLSKPDTAPKSTTPNQSSSPYVILRNAGNEVYVSDAGVRYTRGSEEGHRLKHLEKHLSDIPERPGAHGVFQGDWNQTLEWIDEAYRRSSKPDKRTNVRKENNRSVIETEFETPIGFLGGRDGARKGNPPARRLRLVMEGDRLITAFPF